MVVLVVDDSATIRLLITHALRAIAGVVVVEACDGADGLVKLDEIRPDIILTDLNMPNVDGFSFIEALRRRDGHARTPVVILTTRGPAREEERARALGVAGYVTKPIRTDDVVEIVQKLVGESS